MPEASGRRRGCDGKEIGGHQRGAADQPAIDVGLRKQRGGVVGLATAAIEDRQQAGDFSIAGRNFATDEGVDRLRLLRRRGPPVPIAQTGS